MKSIINKENFLIRLLEKKKNIPKEIKKDIDSFRYLEHGQIDSLELISFVISIEKKFSIKFTTKDLSSKEFRTVIGLLKLIEKKIKL